jgi:hypothetical protein
MASKVVAPVAAAGTPALQIERAPQAVNDAPAADRRKILNEPGISGQQP